MFSQKVFNFETFFFINQAIFLQCQISYKLIYSETELG